MKKITSRTYKDILIDDILDFQTRNRFTCEVLEKKSVRTLEIIYDNVD